MSDTITYETPVQARLWKEGKRIYEECVVAVETDGDTVTVTDDEGEETFGADEWDELTVVLV